MGGNDLKKWGNVKKILFNSRFLTFLSPLLFLGGCWLFRPWELKNDKYAYIAVNGQGIEVINGANHAIDKISTSPPEDGRWHAQVVPQCPQVSPKNDQIVYLTWGPIFGEKYREIKSGKVPCLECDFVAMEPKPGSDSPLLMDYYDVIQYDLGTKKSTTLVRTVADKMIRSPIWSPDQSKIYFFVQERMYSYALSTGAVTLLCDVSADRRVKLEINYCRFAPDGKTIWATASPGNTSYNDPYRMESVWQFSPEGPVKVLNSYQTGRIDSAYSAPDPTKIFNVIPPEAIETLFSDPQNPQIEPQHSADYSYSFSLKQKTFIWGTEWIDCYDHHRHKHYNLGVTHRWLPSIM